MNFTGGSQPHPIMGVPRISQELPTNTLQGLSASYLVSLAYPTVQPYSRSTLLLV